MSIKTAITKSVCNVWRNATPGWTTAHGTTATHQLPLTSPCTVHPSIPLSDLPSPKLSQTSTKLEEYHLYLHQLPFSDASSLASQQWLSSAMSSCSNSSTTDTLHNPPSAPSSPLCLSSTTSAVPKYHKLKPPQRRQPLTSLLSSSHQVPSKFTEIAETTTVAEEGQTGERGEVAPLFYQCGFLTDVRVKQYNKIRGKPGIRKRDAGMYWQNYKCKWNSLRKRKRFL
eukprot:GHVS01043323.1.p1 GENE.GHVS01043323.1~~GHVS01043323.1.p1  ORF type:complete len:227 (-),score=45.08 GHVS01043323.1:142-822(-)